MYRSYLAEVLAHILYSHVVSTRAIAPSHCMTVHMVPLKSTSLDPRLRSLPSAMTPWHGWKVLLIAPPFLGPCTHTNDSSSCRSSSTTAMVGRCCAQLRRPRSNTRVRQRLWSLQPVDVGHCHGWTSPYTIALSLKPRTPANDSYDSHFHLGYWHGWIVVHKLLHKCSVFGAVYAC